MSAGGKVKVKCAFCGQTKEIYPSIKRMHKNHFCDRNCLYLFRFTGGRNSKYYKSMRQMGITDVKEFKSRMREQVLETGGFGQFLNQVKGAL